MNPVQQAVVAITSVFALGALVVGIVLGTPMRAVMIAEHVPASAVQLTDSSQVDKALRGGLTGHKNRFVELKLIDLPPEERAARKDSAAGLALLTGKDSCNLFSVQVRIDKGKLVNVGPVTSTQMYCDDRATQDLVGSLLKNGTTFHEAEGRIWLKGPLGAMSFDR